METESEARKVLLSHQVVTSPDQVEVFVYKPGPGYGHWRLELSPLGNVVRVWHSLPARCGLDGSFVDLIEVDSQSWPTDTWHKDPVSCLTPVFGASLASEVAQKAVESLGALVSVAPMNTEVTADFWL